MARLDEIYTSHVNVQDGVDHTTHLSTGPNDFFQSHSLDQTNCKLLYFYISIKEIDISGIVLETK